MNSDLFLQVQKTLFNYLDPYPLFEAILDFLPQLGADFGSILLQAENQTTYYRSNIPGQEDLLGPAGRRLAKKLMAEGLEGYVMREGSAVIVNNVAENPYWYTADYLIKECRSAVVLPLSLNKAEVRGALVLGSRAPDEFSSADLLQLETIAAQIGYAIENTLLHKNQLDRSAQLNLINEVSRAATSILNVNLMLTTVTQAIQRSFEFYSVSIYRLTPANKRLLLNAITGADGRSFAPNKIILEVDRFIAWVVEHKKTLVANDVLIDERFIAGAENSNVKSKLIIPIKLGVKIVGILRLDSAKLDTFSPPLVAALETLSDQLAVAIENARLYDELNDTVNELLSLNRITQLVSSSLDMQSTLTLIAEQVISMLQVAATSVALRDDEKGELWFAAASGEGSQAILGKRMNLGQGIVGWVAETGTPIIVPDVHKDPRFFPDMDEMSGFKTQSILCVPLETKGRLIGAIEVMNKLDGAFTNQDLERLSALTAPAATAIENAQLFNNVETLKAFNENIIANITTGLIALDTRGTITVFNKAASALLGLRTESLIGRLLTSALAHIPRLTLPLRDALADQRLHTNRNIEITHWDGSQIVVTVTAAPMYNHHNKLTGVVGLIEDLTELKTLEAERRLLDRLAALGEMSAVIAHELRNPIAGIAAGVNYLTKKIPYDSDDYQAGQMILKEVERVHRIVEDILLVARPMALQQAPHSLPEIINAVGRQYRQTLQENNIHLRQNFANDLPPIDFDRRRIEQVISNLFENAIQAMPEGGSIEISIAQHPVQNEAEIMFKDSGPGISQPESRKIFEPFYTTKTRGTGLGLALSRQILEAHQGTIDIAASDETGTTIEIKLPLSKQP